MVDRQRYAGVVGDLGRGGQGLHGASCTYGGRRGVGHLLQRAAPDPFGDHQATGAGVDDIKDSGDAGFVDSAQPHGARQDLAKLVVGKRPVGVHERQRHLPVQRSVQGLPELQMRRPAVEDQQPVAAARDAGAGDQVLVVVPRRRLRRRLVRRIEVDRIALAESCRFEAGIGRRFAVGSRRGLACSDGADLEIGRDVGLEIVSERRRCGVGDSFG